jgi:hypothetical protein
MNATSRAILQSVISTDTALSEPERAALQGVLDGVFEMVATIRRASDEPMLITQKAAAHLLSVSRVTVWRMTRDGLLHPIELLPGTVRYSLHEVEQLARSGCVEGLKVA